MHPHVLKECSKVLDKPLSIIFNRSFHSGVIPDAWLIANITTFFKKGNKLELTNDRPVSLTSIVCKIMERIVRDTMINHLVSNNLIANEQHGFVNNKSCFSNLLETIDFITQSVEDGLDLDVLFLDIC